MDNLLDLTCHPDCHFGFTCWSTVSTNHLSSPSAQPLPWTLLLITQLFSSPMILLWRCIKWLFTPLRGGKQILSLSQSSVLAICSWFLGLADNVKGELVARDETESLKELNSLAIWLDNWLCERHRERIGRQGFPHPSAQITSTASAASCDAT